MAVPRPTPRKKKNQPSSASTALARLESKLPELSAMAQLRPIQKQLVLWIAKGKDPPEFARKYSKQICPKFDGDYKDRDKRARERVRKWKRSELFRQALWDWSMTEVDLAMPDILKGIVNKAAAGRVDAARLALELTGRHAPNSEVQPAAIQIIMSGVPRPVRDVETVDGEGEEIEDAELDEAL